MIVFTLGHSTLTQDAFIVRLKSHGVERLADIRTYPGSRTVPHFGKEKMSKWLPAADIEYVHLLGLGGRKHICADGSPNLWWKHKAFRSYADYALTDAFRVAFKELLKLASEKPTAIMCSEAVWWKCHRWIVTDYLLASGVDVRHIMGDGAHNAVPAKLSSGAVPSENAYTPAAIVYPPAKRFECTGTLL